MKSDYDIARKRVKKRLDFRSHLATYLIICGFLFAINLFSGAGPGHLWAIWPALGWGIGVAFHGLSAYGIIADKEDEEELIEREVNRMRLDESEEEYLEKDELELREIRKERRYNEDDLV